MPILEPEYREKFGIASPLITAKGPWYIVYERVYKDGSKFMWKRNIDCEVKELRRAIEDYEYARRND